MEELEQALCYEYLIRAAHGNCSRREFGADADIFRSLESASVKEKDRRTIDTRSFSFKMGEVVAYLHLAFERVTEKYKDDNDFCCKINECQSPLFDWELSLQDIDTCIVEARRLFQEKGISLIA